MNAVGIVILSKKRNYEILHHDTNSKLKVKSKHTLSCENIARTVKGSVGEIKAPK